VSDAETVASLTDAARVRFPDSELLRGALECARSAHARQRRRDGSPFIRHPVGVARVLADAGFDEEVRAAALLHDVVEHTETTLPELSRRFDERVVGLVAAMTEDPAIADYAARKSALRDQVEGAGRDAMAIYAADKLINVGELGRAYAREGERVGLMLEVSLDTRIEIWRADLEAAAGCSPELPHVRDLRYQLESLEEMRVGRDGGS
jgi:guanosine-3',5'-bis(diphosphate) 3'-pyrophosphohydrolase